MRSLPTASRWIQRRSASHRFAANQSLPNVRLRARSRMRVFWHRFAQTLRLRPLRFSSWGRNSYPFDERAAQTHSRARRRLTCARPAGLPPSARCVVRASVALPTASSSAMSCAAVSVRATARYARRALADPVRESCRTRLPQPRRSELRQGCGFAGPRALDATIFAASASSATGGPQEQRLPPQERGGCLPWTD